LIVGEHKRTCPAKAQGTHKIHSPTKGMVLLVQGWATPGTRALLSGTWTKPRKWDLPFQMKKLITYKSYLMKLGVSFFIFVC